MILFNLFAKFIGARAAGVLIEVLKVAAIVAVLAFVPWWLRHDAARDATAAANAQCQRTIQRLEDQHREEADRRAEDAQSADEALPLTPADRRELERLCAADEDCRDQARVKGGK